MIDVLTTDLKPGTLIICEHGWIMIVACTRDPRLTPQYRCVSWCECLYNAEATLSPVYTLKVSKCKFFAYDALAVINPGSER